jgi:acyl-CoA synthetase (AMP-forming)/AMP-acid ligase II
MRDEAVTTSFASPVLWDKLISYCERTEQKLPQLKRALMAGTAVPVALIERLRAVAPNAEAHTPYGATEGLPLCSASGSYLLEHYRATGLNCIGKPLAGIQMRLIRPVEAEIRSMAQVQFCEPGEVGEMIACGPVVSERYDRLLLENIAAKIQDGPRVWHRMGDLAYLDARGDFIFCGRKAERVFVGRKPYDTAPVEALVNAHPEVYRSALIGVGTEAAIVIEPKVYPKKASDLAALESRLTAWVKEQPVDVRHNAKIHRLTLGREYSQRLAAGK